MTPPPRRDDWDSFASAGTIGRIMFAADKLHRSGLLATALAVAMLTVFVSMAAGYMPSPLTKLSEQIKSHDANTLALTVAIDGLTVELRRQNRRMLFAECAKIDDPALRSECLRD